MKTLLQAFRAVFVELLGVLVVLWALFSSAAWTLESAGFGSESSAGSGLLAVFGRPFEKSPERADDEDQVAQRLEYYSQLYGRALERHVEQAAGQLITPGRSAPPSAGQGLLGSM